MFELITQNSDSEPSTPYNSAALHGLVAIKSYSAGDVVFKENQRSQVTRNQLIYGYVFEVRM
jgi:hypothetical protein